MSSEARTYACASCGAHVGELVRRCPYCQASVATVRCGRCFQMNVPEALHCSGCGHELGLEPIAEGAALSCPGCRQSLAAFRADGGALFDCERCGGQFVEHALLRALLERREVLGDAVPTGSEARATTCARATGAMQPVRYVPCPACSTVMNRKNFGGTSGVVVDVCKKDGMWFDAGELPRVLAFVASGGLARARHRDEERRAEEKRAEIARAIASSSMGTAGAAGAESDAALGLLDFLRRL